MSPYGASRRPNGRTTRSHRLKNPSKKLGWRLFAGKYLLGDKGGRSSGTAIATRGHINAVDGTNIKKYQIPSHVVKGRAHAVVIDGGPIGSFVVYSVYFQTGGWDSTPGCMSVNCTVLREI